MSEGSFLMGLILPGLPIFGGLYIAMVYNPMGYILSLGGFLMLIVVLASNAPGSNRDGVL